MKKIAVIVYDLINNYSRSVLEGVTKFFAQKKDVQLIICPVYAPKTEKENHNYQYWTSIQLLVGQDVDSVIIVTNSLLSAMSMVDLEKELKCLEKKNLVSVAVPFRINNLKYTHNSCKTAFQKVVRHLIKKHGCKRFAFFSASKIDSIESIERLEAYKEALESNGILYKESDVLPGDFTPGCAHQELLNRYKSKEEFPYDAVLCVNDYTAGGVLLFCEEMGISVPDEVKVFGFDDSEFALITYPTLSSINQSIPYNGYKCAEIAYRLAKGEEVEKETTITSQAIYRQSCGCVECEHHSTAYVDEDGKYFSMDAESRKKEKEIVLIQQTAMENINDMIDLMDVSTSFSKITQIIQTALQKSDVTGIIACFYEQPVSFNSVSDFELPKEARVLMFANNETGEVNLPRYREAKQFNPNKELVPKEFANQKDGTYFLVPIYLHENNYGYIICKSNITQFTLASVYLKILNTIIIHAYMVSKEQAEKQMLIEQKHKLNMESKTDELTHIFNRRGFLEYGQKLMMLSAATGKNGLVFFCDLDGLKTINDTYGHDVGDAAILTEAQVLAAAFRNSDMIGRLSGDEFGVVAPGFTLENVPKLRERLVELNRIYSEENELPFILSISVGPIEFKSEEDELEELLKKADEQLYEEKKIKHSKDKHYYKKRPNLNLRNTL